MKAQGILYFISYLQRKYWIIIIGIIVISFMISALNVMSAKKKATDTSVSVPKMKPYISLYPSVTEVHYPKAFVEGLTGKMDSNSLNLNWVLTTDDTLEEIKKFYLSDMQARGYKILKKSDTLIRAEKGEMVLKVIFANKDDGKRHIYIIIFNKKMLQPSKNLKNTKVSY